MTPQAFGQLVQSKYPQYSNLPPEQVANLVIQKYPQYQSQINQQGGGILNDVKDVGLGIAKGIGQIGENVSNTVNRFSGGLLGVAPENQDQNLVNSLQPTNTAQKVGSFIGQSTPFLLAPELEGAGALANAGLQSATAGAVSGLQGENPLPAAATAGGLSLLGSGLSNLAKSLPEGLYNKALKPSLDELKRNEQFGTPTLNQQLLNSGIAGSPEHLLSVAQEGLKTNEDALQNVLQTAPGQITREQIAPYFNPLIEKISNTPGLQGDFKQLTDVFEQIPAKMTLSEANVIKRNLYNTLNDIAFKLDSNLSTKREGMKAVALGLKTEIENATSQLTNETGQNLVQFLNQNLAMFGKLQKRTLTVLAQETKRNPLGLGDLLLLGAGVASGHPMLGVAEDVAKKTLTSPTVLTKTALAVKNAGKSKIPKVLFKGAKAAITAASTPAP